MLEGLADIDWASVSHAYGPATDVPDDLRALTSHDPSVREAAIYRLYGSIFHQGTRWRASQHAVPFLFELALEPATGDRHQIVELIGHLAVGYHESWLWNGLDSSSFRSGEAEYLLGRNEFEADDLDVYRAVCAHAAELLTLCSDDDPLVRHAVAYNLAFLPDIGQPAVEALVTRVRTEHDELRANALIAVALLCQALDQPDPIGFDAFLRGTPPVVAYGAATGRARLGGAGTDEALAVLVAALTDPPSNRLYWNEGDLVGFAAETLAFAQGRFGEELTARLCGLLRNSEGPSAEKLVVPLLRSLFPRGKEDVPRLAADLGLPQRMLVETLAESPRTWTWNGISFANFSLTVHRWGLPGSADEAARYLSGTPIEDLRPNPRWRDGG